VQRESHQPPAESVAPPLPSAPPGPSPAPQPPPHRESEQPIERSVRRAGVLRYDDRVVTRCVVTYQRRLRAERALQAALQLVHSLRRIRCRGLSLSVRLLPLGRLVLEPRLACLRLIQLQLQPPVCMLPLLSSMLAVSITRAQGLAIDSPLHEANTAGRTAHAQLPALPRTHAPGAMSPPPPATSVNPPPQQPHPRVSSARNGVEGRRFLR
jgi:hypothetical protein